MERILHGSQVSQPSKSLQGNFGLDEQYVELFIFPPGQQQAFDGCLNPILQQQQQQHLWHKISRESDFWNSFILLSLCSFNLILYCILSSAAFPWWFSSIFFLHLPAFHVPLSFCSILSPINVQNTFLCCSFFPTWFCTQELQRKLSTAINYARFPIWKQRAEKTWVEVSLETELCTWIMRLNENIWM